MDSERLLYKMPSRQLAFDLSPDDVYAPEFFVPHSGVQDACEILSEALYAISNDASAFRLVYLWGPAGIGKTHLISTMLGISPKSDSCEPCSGNMHSSNTRITLMELADCIDDGDMSKIVSAYDARKREGGLMVFSARVSPKEITTNPHAQTRFLAGSVVALGYPKDVELRPLLCSLMERRNLKLSEAALEYLVDRFPADPLSFSMIFDKISELCYESGRSARRNSVVREAVRESLGQKLNNED